MKKLLLCFLVSASFIACNNQETKTEKSSNSYPANATGYNLDSSENINIALKASKAGTSFDTTTLKTLYSDNAVIVDNQINQSLSEYIKSWSQVFGNGVKVTLDSIPVIWESVENKEDDLGIKNYVHGYIFATATRQEKKASLIMNFVFAFKNGKIVKEWDTYDSAPLVELMK